MMACKQMCEKLNIHDFSYNDLVDPDFKRIKVLMTELARFALHKLKMKDEILPVLNHHVQNAFYFFLSKMHKFTYKSNLISLQVVRTN